MCARERVMVLEREVETTTSTFQVSAKLYVSTAIQVQLEEGYTLTSSSPLPVTSLISPSSHMLCSEVYRVSGSNSPNGRS